MKKIRIVSIIMFIFISTPYAFSTSKTYQKCGKELKSALKKLGINYDFTDVSTRPFSSKIYKRDRGLVSKAHNKLFFADERLRLLQEENYDLIDKLTFRKALGNTYITEKEYLEIQDQAKENAKPGSDQKNYMNNLLMWIKNSEGPSTKTINSEIKKYSDIQQDYKTYLSKFNEKYDDNIEEINGDISFNLLIEQNNDFDTISTNEKRNVDAYLRQNKVIAYSVVESNGDEILVSFKPGNCSIDRFVFINKIKSDGFTTAGSYSYITPKYCQELGQLSHLEKKLPTDSDPNEYKLRCLEQGASDNCRCPNGNYINPWVSTCKKIRNKPKVTAADKFELFARDRGALPGSFWSRSVFKRSQKQCEKVKKMLSTTSYKKDKRSQIGIR